MLTIPSRIGMVETVATKPWPTDLLWPDPESGPWRVTIWWRTQYGEAAPVGVAVRSWVEDENSFMGVEFGDTLPSADAEVEMPRVGSQMLRDVPIGRLLDETRAKLLASIETRHTAAPMPPGWESWETAAQQLLDEAHEHMSPHADALREKRTGRDLGDEHYREVAKVYRDAVRAGEPPTVAVAAHFTVTKSSAAKKVSRARQRGFLPPTRQGRIGRVSKEL